MNLPTRPIKGVLGMLDIERPNEVFALFTRDIFGLVNETKTTHTSAFPCQ